MLPDDYYLSNFRSLVDFVESTYRSLLTEDEREWLERLANCTKHSQQLYVRLLGRKADFIK